MAFSCHRDAPVSTTPAEIELGELSHPQFIGSEGEGQVKVQDFMKLYSEVDSFVRRMEGVKERAEMRQRELKVLQKEQVERTRRWVGNRISRWFMEDERVGGY
jgi:hypothetical protein